MRKAGVVLALFLVLSFVAMHPVGAYPGWVKEGAYLKYRASGYYPEIEVDYMHGGRLFVIMGSSVQVSFRILKVENGKALVRATVYMNGTEDEPVQVQYPISSGVKGFWNENSIIRTENYTDYGYTEVNLLNLTISGEYYIDLNRGWVYGPNGEAYGHTVLWNGLKVNDTFAIYNGSDVRISGVEMANVSMKTYYGLFDAPNIILRASPVNVPHGKAVFHGIYNERSDVCISFVGFPVPDLEAIGIKGFLAFDRNAIVKDEDMTSEKLGYVNGMWAWGVVLSETNVFKISPEGGSSYWAYGIVGGVIFLIVALIVFKLFRE
ncbi:hypothetical protein [Thermococcus sp.]